jgi:hypothetical protein
METNRVDGNESSYLEHKPVRSSHRFRRSRESSYFCSILAKPMNSYEFSGFLALSSLLASFLGSLTGLGGGVVIVPLLALAFGVDIHYAIGASLVSVIATSSGAAAAYVRDGF